MRKLIVGTRGSKLALAQTELLCQALSNIMPEIELETKIIKTRGDRFLELSLSNQPDKGLFTREIEAQLLDGAIDMAVHSLKDLPVACVPGTMIGAYLERAKTEDVLIGKQTLEELPEGAVIGTSSKRRAFQLSEKYPHFIIKEIRGNVETRIAKMEAGEYDAILMARAGMERLGLTGKIKQIIPVSLIVPAPGQAAIAIHIRNNDSELQMLLEKIDHKTTRYEVEFERELLQSLGGGCAMPLGCVCRHTGEKNEVEVYYASEDASRSVYHKVKFDDSEREAAMKKLVMELKTVEAR